VKNSNYLILVIEDEEEVRTSIVHLLRSVGFRVVEARDGKQGMAEMREHDVRLVVTDILMPEMDGLEVVMEVRKFYPGTKIVAISKGLEYLTLASTLGAHATIAKPFQAADLLDAIRRTGVEKQSCEPGALYAKPPAPPRARITLPAPWSTLFAIDPQFV